MVYQLLENHIIMKCISKVFLNISTVLYLLCSSVEAMETREDSQTSTTTSTTTVSQRATPPSPPPAAAMVPSDFSVTPPSPLSPPTRVSAAVPVMEGRPNAVRLRQAMTRAITALEVVSMKFNELELLIRQGARARAEIALAELEETTQAAAIANRIVQLHLYSSGVTKSELDKICAQIEALSQESRVRDERVLKLLEEVERSSTTSTRPTLNQSSKISDR